MNKIKNLDIRKAAKAAKVPLWKLAASLGFSEATMTRKLRSALSEDEKRKFFEQINCLKGDDQ